MCRDVQILKSPCKTLGWLIYHFYLRGNMLKNKCKFCGALHPQCLSMLFKRKQYFPFNCPVYIIRKICKWCVVAFLWWFFWGGWCFVFVGFFCNFWWFFLAFILFGLLRMKRISRCWWDFFFLWEVRRIWFHKIWSHLDLSPCCQG